MDIDTWDFFQLLKSSTNNYILFVDFRKFLASHDFKWSKWHLTRYFKNNYETLNLGERIHIVSVLEFVFKYYEQSAACRKICFHITKMYLASDIANETDRILKQSASEANSSTQLEVLNDRQCATVLNSKQAHVISFEKADKQLPSQSNSLQNIVQLSPKEMIKIEPVPTMNVKQNSSIETDMYGNDDVLSTEGFIEIDGRVDAAEHSLPVINKVKPVTLVDVIDRSDIPTTMTGQCDASKS